ncbi:MAG: thiamine pyrophosphate-dependent dehydrogenase E1 component subunit alpha [Caldilineae bacterium]|nr:MAG: thiamine pyrophosphate-dependent dehydrogenase E1 component subunit alpha [Caldilineae bacterium]
MSAQELSRDQHLEIYYWMRLTRTFDDRMLALWKQGRGVGGTFSQRGHEAISVGAGYALGPKDVVAPMHRDLGCYLLRGLSPRRAFASLLGRATGVTAGRDANLHGMGDLSLGLIGFISHLPQSLPVTLGVAMSFLYRDEPRVAMTFTGDGASSAGLFHEVLNMASLYNAPMVIIVENNQYAYSTPLSQQMKVPDIARRADGYGIPGIIVDGNDVEAVYAVTKEAVERARSGGGPTLIEAKTMRMLGHAIHDGAEYVPRELLAEWEKRDPIRLYEERLLSAEICDQAELDEIGRRCEVEIEDAIAYAEASPWPDPATVLEGVYAP